MQGRLCRRRSSLLGLGLLLLFVQLLDRLDFLLELHPPVLEPDFDLPLRQAECVGHFDPAPAGQVVVGVELLLQLQRLVSGVRLPATSSQSVGTCGRGGEGITLVIGENIGRN